MQHFCFHFLEGVRATFTVRWFLQRNVVRFSTAVCGEQHCVKTERTAVKQTMPMQIGDNVTCPWETCGDAKYTFQDPFNHQRSSNTISSPDSSPVISHYLSPRACGVWWEGGKWGRQMTVFLSSPFPSSPAPAVRYVRRLLGTSQYHHTDLLWGAFLLGTIFTSLFGSWLILNREKSR